MRAGPNPKRGRGRGNGRKPSSRNQTFDSNGPNVRIRGSAYQVLEKYLALARDASASGDRISAENFYQHAEHYFRIVSAANAAQNRPFQPSGQPDQAEQPTAAPGKVNGSGEGHDESGGAEADSPDSEQFLA